MDDDDNQLTKIKRQLDAIEESLYALEEMVLELRNFAKPTLDLTLTLLEHVSFRINGVRERRREPPA